MLSLAEILTVTVPLTIAPLDGELMVAVGAVLSTVTVTVLEVPTLPAASYAFATIACEPAGYEAVFQL